MKIPHKALAGIIALAVSTSACSQQYKDPGYGLASYEKPVTGQYLKKWLLAGPIPINTSTDKPTASEQKAFFDKNFVSWLGQLPAVTANNQAHTWKAHSSKDDIIDLDGIFDKADYAAAYALAEIKADSSYVAVLAMGSDDAAKVWHNGKLIHEKWAGRRVKRDEDIFPISLVKGSNQILVEVQDGTSGWGFCLRLLSRELMSDRLIMASGSGNFDEAEFLINAGADINKKNVIGLTALDVAKLSGRAQIESLLVNNGAVQATLPNAAILTDRLFNALRSKEPGAAVLIARDGKILYKKAFGYADLKNNVLVTPQTVFRLSSISKQFAACAILKLQEEGRLQVTDKLSKYIPDFPRADEITLHHLLTHTSGIPDYTDKLLKKGMLRAVFKIHFPTTKEKLLNYFKDEPFDFNPGESYKYNNSGYFLLYCIVEKVSGKNYGQYLKEVFFGPLQMTNTGMYDFKERLHNEPKSYMSEDGNYRKLPDIAMSWFRGAGDLYSTLDDLYIWNEALFNGKVLSDQSMKAAFTPAVLNDGKRPRNASYGYGWEVNAFRNQKVVEHDGNLPGWLSSMSRFVEANLTVIILTNVSPPVGLITADTPNNLAEFYLQNELTEHP